MDNDDGDGGIRMHLMWTAGRLNSKQTVLRLGGTGQAGTGTVHVLAHLTSHCVPCLLLLLRFHGNRAM